MGIIELLLLAVGLSMDAFAVSVCKGLSMKTITPGKAAVCGIWFGGFQALMPMIGYLLGVNFQRYVNAVAPWIAFALLALIGLNMIHESRSQEEEETSGSLDAKTMFLMAVATSIDALAVGITFVCVPVTLFPAAALINTLAACLIIGITTFIISCGGVRIGSVFGTKYKSKAELAGGLILLLIGAKILLQHLFF